MNTDTFHGWTNRETWSTVVHLDSTEWMQKAAMQKAFLYGEIEEWISEVHEMIFYPSARDEVPDDMRVMIADIGSLYRVEWAEVENYFADKAREMVADIARNMTKED